MKAAPTRRAVFYLEAAVLTEIQSEAQRLERPLSWLVRVAWLIAKDRLRSVAAAGEAQAEP